MLNHNLIQLLKNDSREFSYFVITEQLIGKKVSPTEKKDNLNFESKLNQNWI